LTSVTQKWEGDRNQLCVEYAELEAKNCTLVPELVWANVIYIRTIKSRRIGWAGHVAQMREKRNAYRIFVGRPEGKRPLGRPRHQWEDNIKMDLIDQACPTRRSRSTCRSRDDFWSIS
jgi:hypothetical protein